MKKKKSEKANLEKNRLVYFEAGLILALSLTLVAFEWAKSPAGKETFRGHRLSMEDFKQIEQTFRKEEIIQKERPRLTLIINPVDDHNIVIEDPIFPNPEIGSGDPYQLWTIPDPEPENLNEPIDFIVLENRPLFNGGDPMTTFRRYIAEHLEYPREAADNSVQGRVTLEFIIDEHGRMTHVRVLQGVHSTLDEEALRVISSSPDWTPGKQRGKPVRVRYVFPVIFRLNP